MRSGSIVIIAHKKVNIKKCVENISGSLGIQQEVVEDIETIEKKKMKTYPLMSLESLTLK